MTLRLYLWNLFDSQTTLEELREQLPVLEPPSAWISNAGSDRFGAVLFGDPPEELEHVQALIGRAPDVGEEFDIE